MLHRAFALVLMLSAFSLEALAHHGGNHTGKGNNLASSKGNSAASCPAPSVTVTVTAAAGATATAAAGSSGQGSGKGGNNAAAGGATGNNNAGAGKNNGSGNNGAAGNNGKNNGGQGGKGGNNAAAGAAAGNNGNNGGNNNNNAGGGVVGANDASQKSLTLLPQVIATGFESNGQETPTAGQVASLTSNNNFINFCATTKLPITNGKQIKTGSCNPAPMGMIAPQTNMPAAKFVNPPNMGNIAANTPFTITMAIKNLQAGNFVNAQANYYSAPQQLNAQNTIIGHSHFVIEQLQSLTQTTPLDNTKFAFFQGVNTPADGQGNLNVQVTKGLPAGVYRLGSINAAANHQPALVAVAQHGLLDDVVYFTVGGNNGGNNTGNNQSQGNGQQGGNKGQQGGSNNNKGQQGGNGKKQRDVSEPETRRSRRHFSVKRQI